MSDSRKPKVFLSRTTKGLGRIARAVAAVLESRGFEVVHQPDFGMGWRRIRSMLMEKMRDCDAVLCLIGPAYGFAPPRPMPEFADANTGRTEFSYTQMEFLLARRLHKKVITVFLVNPFPFDEFEQTEEEAELQRGFIRDYILKDEHVFYTHSSEDALLEALRGAEIPIEIPLIPPVTPENIPFPSLGRIFTGRADTLQTIRENLLAAARPDGNAQPVQLVHGLGGVGKTRVAVEFAHAHAEDYTARLFLRGGSPAALEDSLATLSGFFLLNLEEQDEKENDIRIAAVLRWLQSHPGYLLVIDNVDTDEARAAVAALLPRFKGGHVLITSRFDLWPGDILRLPLDVLSDTDSVTLLLNYRTSPRKRSDTDECDAHALAHDLDGLALALEQAAAFLNKCAYSISEYHALWRNNEERIHEWHDEDEMGYPASVATTWLTTFDRLHPSEQTLLRLLSWLAPDAIPDAMLQPLAERVVAPDPLDGADPRRALGELLNFSLAKWASGGRSFSVHRLVQQITRERQPSPPPALSAALSWVDVKFAEGVGGDLAGHSDDVRNWPVLVPLLPHAIAAGTFGADRDIPDPSARLLSVAALLLHSKANRRAAVPLYRRALALDKASHGKEHPTVASTLGNLGQLFADLNRPRRAERLMRRALAIDEAWFGSDHPKVAGRLNNLAQLLADTGRTAEAEPLMRRALDIDEAWFGGNHPNVAIRLNNLAQSFADSERRIEAEPLMRRALAIDEAALGQEHPNVAIRLGNLAQLLQTEGRLQEAEPMLRRALEIDTQSLGADHPNVATDYNNLAQLLQAENRLEEAEPMLRQALDIDLACFDENHPVIARDLNNLAQLLQVENRLEEAEPMMRRALAIDENRTPHNPLAVAIRLNNLAQLLVAGGRIEEALPFMRRALQYDEVRFGESHPVIATDLSNLAQLLSAIGNLDEAEELMHRALQIDEQCFGASHPLVARDLSLLGQLLFAQDRLEDAEPVMRRALAVDTECCGPGHPNVATDLSHLAKLLQSTGELDEAIAMMRRALHIDEANFAPDDSVVAADLKGLSQLLYLSANLDEAEALLRRALIIDEQRYGPDDPHVAMTLESLAQVLQSANRPGEATALMRRASQILA